MLAVKVGLCGDPLPTIPHRGSFPPYAACGYACSRYLGRL